MVCTQTFDFDFPLSVTIMHTVLVFGIAAVVRRVRAQRGIPPPQLSWELILRRIAPAGPCISNIQRDFSDSITSCWPSKSPN